jgi:hypothetical protein
VICMKTSCKAKVAGFRVKPGMTDKKNERMSNYLSTRFPEEPENLTLLNNPE